MKNNGKTLSEKANGFVEFSKFSMKIFNDVVLANKQYVDLILNGPYSLNIHSMGLVDENNKVNFYDGKVRVVDTEGKELYKYSPVEYTDFVEERVEPWSLPEIPVPEENRLERICRRTGFRCLPGHTPFKAQCL